MASLTVSPSSYKPFVPGQMIASAMNAGASKFDVYQLRNHIVWPNADSAQILKNNPAYKSVTSTYNLSDSDLRDFFSRFQVDDVVNENGLNVLRALDITTKKQTIFVAGASPAEFLQVGLAETNDFGGSVTQALALVAAFEGWKAQGVDMTGAVAICNSLGGSTLAMAIPNLNVKLGSVACFGGYGLSLAGLSHSDQSILSAYEGLNFPFETELQFTRFMANARAGLNIASTPITNFIVGDDWIPSYREIPFGTSIILKSSLPDATFAISKWKKGLFNDHPLTGYMAALGLQENNPSPLGLKFTVDSFSWGLVYIYENGITHTNNTAEGKFTWTVPDLASGMVTTYHTDQKLNQSTITVTPMPGFAGQESRLVIRPSAEETAYIVSRLNKQLETIETREIYVIKKGETLDAIERRLELPAGSLMRLNPDIVNADKIYAGEQIYLPGVVQDNNLGAAPAGTVLGVNEFYVDATYNALSLIAEVTGTSVEALIAANPGLGADMTIQAGVRVRLPLASNTFTLTTSNTLTAVTPGSADALTEAQLAQNGTVASGSTWRARYNIDDLNRDQFVDGFVDNTSAAAATQILSDGFRPGNGNLVGPVIDPNLALLGSGFYDSSAELLGVALNLAGTQARLTLPTDPLVLDLNGDGVRLTHFADAPVLFDTDNDGNSLEQTGWVSREDGIVVLDHNGNGKIDNIGEIFSEYFGGAAGVNGNAGAKPFRDGFAALGSLDSNADGVFDNRDAAWSEVRVWIDANHDGKSWQDTDRDGVADAGELSELRTLDELGITGIGLVSTPQSGDIRDGNEVLASGRFVMNGTSHEALAANFVANPIGSTVVTNGSGTIVRTEGSGKAGPSSTWVASSALGVNINLALLGVRHAVGGAGDDILTGDAANNWLAGGAGSDRFLGGAGDDVLLIDADDRQEDIHAGEGSDIVQAVGERGIVLNLAQAGVEIAQGGRGNDIFIGGGRSSVYLRGGDGGDMLIGGAASDALLGEDGEDFLDGGYGNDMLRGGRGRDQLAGGQGDDYLDGGLDDDSLFGGAGNDVLRGGAGDDIIDGGDGIDAIELSGSYADYRITRTDDGIWISDSVAGRDGTDFVKGVEQASFKDIRLTQLPGKATAGLNNPQPARDVLFTDGAGAVFTRTAPHLISRTQLLGNDIDFQGDALTITELFDVSGGVAVITEAGDILFTPDPDFSGFMKFNYSVTDARGNASMPLLYADGQRAIMRAAVTLMTPELPDDPLLAEQWYLASANVLPVWKDYSGKGVRIGEFESVGEFATTKELLDYRHPDLQANIDPFWLANATPGELVGESSNEKFSSHATTVAGVMVGARNGEGIVGVAYDATVASYSIFGGYADLAHMREFDVANNSWGADKNFSLRMASVRLNGMWDDFSSAIAQGRNGLGTVIVNSAGNFRAVGGNTNYSILSNSRSGIVVAAINAKTNLGLLQNDGKPFSSPGASILVAAPGSLITTTGYLVQNDNGTVFGGETLSKQGTSFSAPIVSGIVALMFEANRNLGYRDVQQILALSATKIADPATSWQTNGGNEWNGGGMHASHDYGFGAVDARAAVRLAETWITQQTYGNEATLQQPPDSGVINLAIAEGAGTVTAHTLHVAGANISIEHVEIHVRLKHARPGDLILKLISPSGTESILMNRPGKAPGSADNVRGDGSFGGSDTLDYVFDTALLRGETATGAWTLQLIDMVTGDTGTLNRWSMDVYGQGHAENNQYIYTGEYAQLAADGTRSILEDIDGGIDTINAAAISGASRIDLSAGAATLAGAALTILNAAAIENAIGGEADDLLTGNAAMNLLRGGRGNDLLDGRDGNDTLDGGFDDDVLTGGAGSDLFVIRRDAGATDVITDFGIGSTSTVCETIALLGFNAASVAALSFSQAGDDVRIDLGDDQTLWLRNRQLSQLAANPDQIRFFEDDAAMRRWQIDFRADDSLTPVSRLFGTPGDDVLGGATGRDLIEGGDGNDRLQGEEGDDILIGGAGQDRLDGGNGDDIIFLDGDIGEISYESRTANAGVRIGGEGADRFVVTADGGGNPEFSYPFKAGIQNVAASNFVADFDVAADKIDLSRFAWITGFSQVRIGEWTWSNGSFITQVSATNGAETVTVNLNAVHRAGLNKNHFIFANSLDAAKLPGDMPFAAGAGPLDIPLAAPPLPTPPVIAGTSGNDVLLGDAGGNRIDGGVRADEMTGRTGDDTYIVDNVGDRVMESAGGGHDIVRSSISYSLPDEVETLILTGEASIDGTGNALINRITGNAGDNILDGGAGSDDLAGGDGNDTYLVDDSADRVRELDNGGLDTVRSSVSFTLADHLENLVLTGSASINGTGNGQNNFLTGNDAGNILSGGAGDDTLDGGAGVDTLMGGAGNDIYVFGIGSGVDRIVEEAGAAGGRDTIVLQAGLSAADVTLERSATELVLRLASGERMVSGWSATQGYRIENILFADGSAWTTADFEHVLQRGPAPVIRLADQEASEEAAFSLVLAAGLFAGTHGEGATLRASLADGSALPAWLSFDPDTRRFSGTPDDADLGTLGIRISHSDAAHSEIFWAFDIRVNGVNDAPVAVLPLAELVAREDEAFRFTLPGDAFRDADGGDVLRYSACLEDGAALPAWLAFDAVTHTFSGTPDNDAVGVLRLTVSATDAAGASASAGFTLTIGNTNDAPIAAAPAGDRNARQGEAFRFSLADDAFTDIDAGDTLTLTATLADGAALPDWLVFDAGSRTFSGIPAGADDLAVRVSATDGAGACADLILTIAVATAYQQIDGTDDHEWVEGSDADERMAGLDGDDGLSGMGGDDLLLGGAGNDYLQGGSGNDILDGGAGSDTLNGGDGNDTYLMQRGMGWDSIDEYGALDGGYDRVLVGTGIRPSDIWVTRDVYRLYLEVEGTGDKLTLQSWFSRPGARIEEVVFEDGTIWDVNRLTALSKTVATADANTLVGEDGKDEAIAGMGGDDRLYGLGGDDALDGGDGKDYLYGGDGNDVLDGGAGADYLIGGLGDDTYLFRAGMGEDHVKDYDNTPGNKDVIQIGEGIEIEQLWFSKTGWEGRDLKMQIIGTGDSMTIYNWNTYVAEGELETATHIEEFRSSNGRTLIENQVNVLIDAMAAFAPPAPGQTTLPADYQAALAPVLAASWK